MLDERTRLEIREEAIAEYRAFWNVATPAYALVAALTVAIAIQAKATLPDLYATAVVATVALVETAAAISLTDFGLEMLGYRGPDLWCFLATVLRNPIARAIIAFFIAHGIGFTGNAAVSAGLVLFAAAFAYFQWSEFQKRV